MLLVGLLFVVCSSESRAQVQFPSDTVAAIPDSLESVPFSFLNSMERCGFFLIPSDQAVMVIRDSATFTNLIENKRFIGQCKDLEIPEIDFSSNILVGFDLFFDCNAKVFVGVMKDTARPVYTVYADIHDGMCRGMTSRSYWVLIPVEHSDAQVEFHKQKHRWNPR